MLVLTALVVEHRLARVARVSCIGGGDAGTDCSSGGTQELYRWWRCWY